MGKFISAGLCISVLEDLHAFKRIYHSLLSLLNTGLLAPFGQLSECAPLLRVIRRVCLALLFNAWPSLMNGKEIGLVH